MELLKNNSDVRYKHKPLRVISLRSYVLITEQSRGLSVLWAVQTSQIKDWEVDSTCDRNCAITGQKPLFFQDQGRSLFPFARFLSD